MKILTYSVGVWQTNCYFIVDDAGNAAAVDPGDDFDKLKSKIEERMLHVEAILLTHGHFDHIGALEQLRGYTGAPVYIHSDDAALLCDADKSYMKPFGGRDDICRPAEKLLCDGDTINIGEVSVKVIHTPGHTPGSVCYLATEGEQRALLSGDTLFRGSIGRYDLLGGDYEQILSSLKILHALPFDCKVYPGHGASTRLEAERETNVYMK